MLQKNSSSPPDDKYSIHSQFAITDSNKIIQCLALGNDFITLTKLSDRFMLGIFTTSKKTSTSMQDIGNGNPLLFRVSDDQFLVWNNDQFLLMDRALIKTPLHSPHTNLNDAVIWGQYLVYFYFENRLKKSVIFYDMVSRIPAYRVLLDPISSKDSLTVLSPTKLIITQANRASIVEKISSGFKYKQPRFLIAPQATSLTLCALSNEYFVQFDKQTKQMKICAPDLTTISERLITFSSPLGPRKFALLADKKSLLSFGERENEICIWDLATLEPRSLCPGAGKIQDFDVLSNGNVLLATDKGVLCLRLNHILQLKAKRSAVNNLILFPKVLQDMAKDYLTEFKVSPEEAIKLDELKMSEATKFKP